LLFEQQTVWSIILIQAPEAFDAHPAGLAVQAMFLN
jgi:hypothetical protein